MKHISSPKHPLIKQCRALHEARGRREQQAFLIEGANAVESALLADVKLSNVLVAGSREHLWHSRLEKLGVDFVVAAPHLIVQASDTAGPVEILAIAPFIEPAPALPDDGLILILDGIGDPGNVGTLLRAADAMGASQFAATAGSADVFAPKTVRASAGSLWSVPLSPLHGAEPAQAVQVLGEAGVPIVTAEAHGGGDCGGLDWPARCALVIGHETRGVSPEFSKAASAKATIPIWGRAESLNAAMAGTLLLYAWRRGAQR